MYKSEVRARGVKLRAGLPPLARHHAARRAVHRSRRALLRLPLPPPPPRAPLPAPFHVLLLILRPRPPPPPAGPAWSPHPRRAAARRPGPARRSRRAGAQVRARHVPQDGHGRGGGGVVPRRGADVPQGAGRALRQPPRRGQRRRHHVRVPEHGVRKLRAQVEADAQAGQRAPARGARARRLGVRAPGRGRPPAARRGGGGRRRAARRRAGRARVRARQHRGPDHRQQAGVRRAGGRVQQLQGDDRVAADGRGPVQHQRLRAGAGAAGPAGRAGEAAADPPPVRRPHHQAAGGARRHGRRPRAPRPPGLRRQAPRQHGRRRRRRERRDHQRGQHQGPHLRHVHGWHGHVVDHRGVGDGGAAAKPVGDGARAGGAGPRGGARPAPGGVGPGEPPLPAGRLQGGHAATPLDAAQPPALLLRRLRRRRRRRRRRLPRPRQHPAAHQHLGHRPRPFRVGGAARVPARALPPGRRRREGGPARELLRAHPLRRRPQGLRREAGGDGVRAVLPGHAAARLRLAPAGRRGEAGHGRDLRPRAAQGRAAPRRRHAAPRAPSLRLSTQCVDSFARVVVVEGLSSYEDDSVLPANTVLTCVVHILSGMVCTLIAWLVVRVCI